MTPLLITWVLTVLAAVAVVGQPDPRQHDGEAAGHIAIPKSLLNLHTIAGVPALLVWVAFLVTGNTVLGWVGLLLWWVTVVAGLLVLARWVPAKGKHSSGPATDSWSEGPGLSILAHVGLLVGTIIWTVFLSLDKIP